MKQDQTKPKLHRDRDWLKEQLKTRSLDDIGKECGVSKQAIDQMRIHVGLPAPGKRPGVCGKIDVSWLREQVEVKRRCRKDIAADCGVSQRSLERHCVALGIRKKHFTPKERKARNNEYQNARYAADQEFRDRKRATSNAWAKENPDKTKKHSDDYYKRLKGAQNV